MQFITNGQKYIDPREIDAGFEGVVYAMNADSVAKIYSDERLREEPQRRQKVLALCNSFENFAHIGKTGVSAAFPQFPAYQRNDKTPDDIIGFAMRWFKDCPKIEKLGFDLESNDFREENGIRFDDKRALGFIYNVFEAVDHLHAARIVLGDVNPGNILYNPVTQRPVVIDLDAAQVGSFGCPTTLDLYNDPLLEQRPKTLCGNVVFDAGTDTFALAVVCFEFWVGARPHYLHRTPLKPQKGDVENKRWGISSIRCAEFGRDYLAKHGVKYLDCPQNTSVECRIARLKTQDPTLYDYFIRIFVNGERENLLLSLPVEDRRHPGFKFLADPDFTQIIDKLVRERGAAPAQAKQGYIQPGKTSPDSDFVRIIDSLATATAKRQVARKAQPRPDPAGFGHFLRHFGLGA